MLRILGEDNDFTNQGWLSDKGRYNFEYLHSDKRITLPLLIDSSTQEISINESMDLISKEIFSQKTSSVSFIVGPNSTNEEYFALNNFVNEIYV